MCTPAGANLEVMDVVIAGGHGQIALRLEKLLTDAGLDYLVEPDKYSGGIIFQTERVGAFFYVIPESEAAVREAMRGGGFRPYQIES